MAACCNLTLCKTWRGLFSWGVGYVCVRGRWWYIRKKSASDISTKHYVTLCRLYIHISYTIYTYTVDTQTFYKRHIRTPHVVPLFTLFMFSNTPHNKPLFRNYCVAKWFTKHAHTFFVFVTKLSQNNVTRQVLWYQWTHEPRQCCCLNV